MPGQKFSDALSSNIYVGPVSPVRRGWTRLNGLITMHGSHMMRGAFLPLFSSILSNIFFSIFFPPVHFRSNIAFIYVCGFLSLSLLSLSLLFFLFPTHPRYVLFLRLFRWSDSKCLQNHDGGDWECGRIKLAGNRLTNVRARLIGWDFYEWNGHMHTYYTPNKFDLAGGKSSLQHSNHDRWLTPCLSHSRILSLPLSASPTLPHPLSQRETINGTLHVTEAWPG